MLRVDGIRRKGLSQTFDRHGNPLTGQNASVDLSGSCILHEHIKTPIPQAIDFIGFFKVAVAGTGSAP
ncbi:hypothetical protein [Pseudomonas sp. W5-01]|uniref:hypothetical protein n=1 Tax=Pseudomonas sp. W5-01 TaxID=3097454 RepID=UPI003978C7B7